MVGSSHTYTIKEDENNINLLYYYQEPVYDQENLTVTNIASWIPVNDNDIPQYRITIVKDIVNKNNQKATIDDFNKIKLNINDTYKFPITLKQLNRTLSKGETSMLENYAGYSGNIYNGIVTNKGNLVFNRIPAVKYEISEGFVQYFSFVNFTELSSTEGAKLTKENGKYYITISGITTNDEYIETKVTNKLDTTRPYNDKNIKENLFKY